MDDLVLMVSYISNLSDEAFEFELESYELSDDDLFECFLMSAKGEF